MWIADIKLKHDCIIGNRCEKFNVIMQSLDLTEIKEKGKVITSSIHQLTGRKENIKEFIKDLNKDKRIINTELNGTTLFLVESAIKKPVSQYIKKKLFVIKPVIIDNKGYEYWEVASYEKQDLMDFIKKVKQITQLFELKSIKNTPLQDIYFPKIMPKLTDLQKEALELAVKEGYYESPKKTNLRVLAKLMKISLATYQKHLQKAESKVIPDVISFLK